jgi:tetratricopeptide (TPR) repeat protein
VKSKLNLVLMLLLTGLLAVSSFAEKGRKLPPKAYLTSAKIEIIGYGQNKEQARIVTAMAMLDSLVMNYGAHPEGYYWYSQIKWDLAKEKANLKERLPMVRAAVAYADSLKAACGNEAIKKDYRKDCSKLDQQMDSVRVEQWREYFNNGIAQIKEVEEQTDAVKSENAKSVPDSAALAFFQTRIDAITDSCQDNMELAIAIDSTDARPFVGLATINEKTGKFDKAIEIFKRAIPYAEDRNQLIISIAYDNIQMGKYCEAIPWFREYVDSMSAKTTVMQDPTNRAAVISTAHNLAICYNNCKEFDEAKAMFGRILSFDPADVGALVGVARYQQYRGREAGDSAKVAREGAQEKAAADWQTVRDQRFDSARVELKKAFDLAPEDAGIAAEYGLMAAILQKYEEAKVAFVRATQLAPNEVDYWTSLGDCNLSLRTWADAAVAYEHVVELQPDRKPVWERLSDLYQETGNKTRREEILNKLKTM